MSAPLPVLLWDRLAAAPRARGQPAVTLLPAADDVLAFCAFIESLDPLPRRLRLFYQSPALESVPAVCPPRAGRRLLRQTLAARFPALAMPATAWAAHPPRTGGGGATTLLYLAQNGFLPQLRAALGARQIRLEEVFPVFVLAEAQPPFAPGDNAALALLQGDEGAGVFWVSPGGERHADFFTGPATGERMQQALANGWSIFEGRPRPPLLRIDATTRPVDPPDLPAAPTRTVSAAEFLAAAPARLPAVANLLPPSPRVSLPALLYATALGLLVLTLALGQQYLAARQLARKNLVFQQAQIAALTAESERLEANRLRIESCGAFLAELNGGPRNFSRFLAALGRARPHAITVHSLTLSESSWTLTATVHEGLDRENGPYAEFCSALFKESGWSPGPDSHGSKAHAADFTLSGTFP